MIYWSAFLLGITGSFHCLGMCAPLMWLIPHGNRGMLNFLSTRFLYQVGRLFTYALLGLTAGIAGQSVRFEPFQSIFLALLGLSLVLFAVFSLNPDVVTAKIPFLNSLSFRANDFLSNHLKAKRNFFTAGVLNGLLPCGLVYTAMLGAVGAGDGLNGMIYMTAFGAGTFPLLMLAAVSGKPINEKMRKVFRLLYPFFLGGAGLLLLWKAFNAFSAWYFSAPLDCH
jgi:sulfite exporter TauE/SafE